MINYKGNQFYFNGRRSFDDLGLVITQTPVDVCAERDIEFVSIPGRSGDVILDNGRYKNVTKSYSVSAFTSGKELEKQLHCLRVWLAKSVGYYKLTDTYDTNYYRMASLSGTIPIEQKLRQIGSGTINFNCKPYRYRIDGDKAFEITGTADKPTVIYNPEEFESAPIIKMTYKDNISLMVNINSKNFLVVKPSKEEFSIEIDCDSMTAFSSGTEIYGLGFDEFPTLKPGKNEIYRVGDGKIEIIPRWRTI